MDKQYRLLAMMEGRGGNIFEMEASAMQMQADRANEDKPESELLCMLEGTNVAVIEIKGKLTNKNSWYNQFYGLVSYDQIREAVIEAMDLEAGAILFDIDSPGGSVSGMHDLSTFIEGIEVKTVAHTSGTMASAAYFLGISCDEVYVDQMAESGSVGVVMTLMQYVEALKKQGAHAEVFRSGKHKQAGNPYEKLSPDNRKYLKGQVETYAEIFFNFVSEQRGMPRPAMADIETGRTFIGVEGIQYGLVDKVMSFDEALAETIKAAEKELDRNEDNGDYTRSYKFNSSAEAQGEQDMAKAISKQALAALVNAGKETPAPDASEGTEELTPEQLAAAAAEDSDKKKDDDDEKDPDDDDDDDEKEETASTSELFEMTEKYDASQVELADLTSKLEASEAALEAAKASHKEAVKPMVDVICSQISTMRIALSLSSVDMSDWEADAIMKEYDNVSKTFESSLPSGGVVPQEGDDKKEASVSREDDRAIKNLGF